MYACKLSFAHITPHIIKTTEHYYYSGLRSSSLPQPERLLFWSAARANPCAPQALTALRVHVGTVVAFELRGSHTAIHIRRKACQLCIHRCHCAGAFRDVCEVVRLAWITLQFKEAGVQGLADGAKVWVRWRDPDASYRMSTL